MTVAPEYKVQEYSKSYNAKVTAKNKNGKTTIQNLLTLGNSSNISTARTMNGKVLGTV
jgi:hypothetical protein